MHLSPGSELLPRASFRSSELNAFPNALQTVQIQELWKCKDLRLKSDSAHFCVAFL